MRSLYQDEAGKLAAAITEMKYNELPLILHQQPEFVDILFECRMPGKINSKEFMHRYFTFNVSLMRFAFPTRRSPSAFKPDFHAIFSQPSSRWLATQCLQEAYFLLVKKKLKVVA